jgi:hypothetical protein
MSRRIVTPDGVYGSTRGDHDVTANDGWRQDRSPPQHSLQTWQGYPSRILPRKRRVLHIYAGIFGSMLVRTCIYGSTWRGPVDGRTFTTVIDHGLPDDAEFIEGAYHEQTGTFAVVVQSQKFDDLDHDMLPLSSQPSPIPMSLHAPDVTVAYAPTDPPPEAAVYVLDELYPRDVYSPSRPMWTWFGRSLCRAGGQLLQEPILWGISYRPYPVLTEPYWNASLCIIWGGRGDSREALISRLHANWRFDSTAWRSKTFDAAPPPDSEVSLEQLRQYCEGLLILPKQYTNEARDGASVVPV